ncbi:MAG TPA: 4-hydroxy-tetrahydrodipicolinate synthase [Acidobacteriaceae bacterium]|jgi:4-hydroxy-tetrahydrodipicolinate synthase|nr:4-hydroxy-tetrahydrodipicolinate synthase [Acidobacteriaceae bacterium]
MKLHGCGTALVTPFLPGGSLDEPALRALVESQLAQGVSLLIPCGTTGEASTLTEAETHRVIEITIEVAAGRAPIFAGCTHNSTAQAVLNAKRIAKIPNLTGILTANPYYNRPNQEGQFQHFRAIAEAVDLPIILYNIPGRTATNLLPETVLRLAELSNIVAVKESSGVMGQITELLANAPTTFSVLAGDDALALPVIALGGTGLVSVASNAIPGAMSSMVSAALAGDWVSARDLNKRYFALMLAHFIEPSPAPIKAVLALLGRCSETLRLPMVPVTDATRTKLESILRSLNLLPTE